MLRRTAEQELRDPEAPDETRAQMPSTGLSPLDETATSIQDRPMQRAKYDAQLAARVVSRRCLLYQQGGDYALGRPPHVRAASGLAWLGGRLAIIQDDANFVALVEPRSGHTTAIALPPGPGGARLFDDQRGNKADKLDLEACFVLNEGDRAQLIALGSGSTPVRERVAVLSFAREGQELTEIAVLDASPLYETLRRASDFSGSELNVEGVVVRGESLLLVQRGNGAIRDGSSPRNATAELSLAAFRAYLATPADASAVPPLRAIEGYDLGTSEGVAFTFTDATSSARGGVLFLASAEASSDSVTDGAVHGTRIGAIGQDGQVRLGPLLDEHGRAARIKAEGIVLDRDDAQRAWVVVDMDDPARASELLELQLPDGL